MSEFQSLLVILGAIYLAECLVWLRLGSVALLTPWGRRWRVWHPSPWAGNERGGFLLLNPLPPLGTLVYGRQFPFSLSPEGVCSWTPACLNGSRRPLGQLHYTRFEDIKGLDTLGKKLLVNGRLFYKAGSESDTVLLAGVLRELKKARPIERAASIERLFADQLDTEKIAARQEELRRRARPIQTLGNALFVSVFVLTPFLIWQFGLRKFLWALVAGVLAQTVSLAVLYFRAHKALLPAAKEERFSWFLTMLLAAPTAMRAHDLLTRRVFEAFHPLALARTLAGPAEFKTLAGHVARDVCHPMEPAVSGEAPGARETVEWSLAAWRKTVEDFLDRSGLSREELLTPPTPGEAGSVAYCPRCHTPFTDANALCLECGGLRLRRFPSAAGSVDRAGSDLTANERQ